MQEVEISTQVLKHKACRCTPYIPHALEVGDTLYPQRVGGQCMSTPLLPEAIPEIDANPMHF